MRETRLSGSVEGVVSNHDPYSDLEIHDFGYLSQYGDLGLMFFIPVSRWLRWVRAQQLECWRLRAGRVTRPTVIDFVIASIISICAGSKKKNGKAGNKNSRSGVLSGRAQTPQPADNEGRTGGHA
jgi:hypothetical protein